MTVLDFPKLDDDKRIEINAKRMMFSDAVNLKLFCDMLIELLTLPIFLQAFVKNK